MSTAFGGFGDIDTDQKYQHELLGEWAEVVLARAGHEVTPAARGCIEPGMVDAGGRLIVNITMVGFLRWTTVGGEAAVQDEQGMWQVGWPALEIRRAGPVPAG